MEKEGQEKQIPQTRNIGTQTDIVAEGSNNNEIDKEMINNIKTYEEYRRVKTLIWPETIFKVTS